MFVKISGEAARLSQNECRDWLKNIYPKLKVTQIRHAGLVYKLALKFKIKKHIGGNISKKLVLKFC